MKISEFFLSENFSFWIFIFNIFEQACFCNVFIDHSTTVPLLQLFFAFAVLVSYVAFFFFFFCHSCSCFLFWCLGKAVIRDCVL